MYQLISAIGILREGTKRWKSVDITNLSMLSIYSQYEKVIATLINTFNPTQKLNLDLDKIKSKANSSVSTFPQYLVTNANNALPTEIGSYEINTKYAGYQDAVRAGYKITPVDRSGVVNSSIPMSDRDWLAMTKQGINYNTFQSHCLVSVNGLFHLTDTDGQKVYVVDGAKSSRICNKTNLGIVSFNNVCPIRLIPIQESMVHKRYPDVPLSKVMYLDLGETFEAKTVGIVIGGYLHVLDSKTFYRVSDSIFAVDFQNYPLLERYYESNRLIDLSSLGLDLDPNKPGLINVPQLKSDAVLKKYITLSQSFIVVFDTLDIFCERVSLPRSRLPDMFISYSEPLYPLITGYGKVSEYWKTYEEPFWSLHVNDGYIENFMFQTFDTTSINNISDSREPSNPVEYGRAQYLKVGIDIKKIIGN